jgi:hypothetical protein
MKKSRKPLPVIGWREWVGLPDLAGDVRIKAKVDTGARSSSIHVVDLEQFEKRKKPWVSFTIYPAQRNKKGACELEYPVLEYRSVRSSSGKAQVRPVIVTDLELLGMTWPVELTLANRDQMGFRMLLGREAFRGRALVDAGKSFYGGQPARPKKKRSSVASKKSTSKGKR